MKIFPGNAQHIGKRKEQQDAFGFSGINDSGMASAVGVLAVLADGMGGLARGRQVSNLAVQKIIQEYASKSTEASIIDAILGALRLANSDIYEIAKSLGTNVGTTLAAAVIHDEQLYWASVGDSRIYLYRNGEIARLTSDHVYAHELDSEAAKGNISREEAESHPERNALTSFLGLSELVQIDNNVKPLPLQPGDRVFICSDGLYGTLSEVEISTHLKADPQAACDLLVKTALSKKLPNQDNLTAIILACEDEEMRSTFVLRTGRLKTKRRKLKMKYVTVIIAVFVAVMVLLLTLFPKIVGQNVPTAGKTKGGIVPTNTTNDNKPESNKPDSNEPGSNNPEVNKPGSSTTNNNESNHTANNANNNINTKETNKSNATIDNKSNGNPPQSNKPTD